MEIARAHLEYGYRRTNAELRDREIQVNRKVVVRLHTSWDLAVIKRIRRPKTSSMAKLLKEAGPRVNLVANLSSILFYTRSNDRFGHLSSESNRNGVSYLVSNLLF